MKPEEVTPEYFQKHPFTALYNYAVSKQPAPPTEKIELRLLHGNFEVSPITMERVLEAIDVQEMRPTEIVEYALYCENIFTEDELNAFLVGFSYGRDAAAKAD